MKATSTYCVEGRLKIEQNDTIAVIDGRPSLSFIKGQNQRTFEIGTFPRNILEVLRFNRHGTLNPISRPVEGSFQHAAHGAAFGPTWGSPAFLDSSYNGKVQMRQKSAENMKNYRQQRTVSEHFFKEKKGGSGGGGSTSKQFSYNKLVNEQRSRHEQQLAQQMKTRPRPERPPPPSASQPKEGILIDLSPEELISMSYSLQNQAKASKPSTLCILDEPIEVPTEGFEPSQQESLSSITRQYSLTYAAQPDPFDTTHLASFENLYANSTVQAMPEPLYNNNPNNRYDRQNPNSDSLNDMLSSSLASMSLASGNQNDNIKDYQLMSTKVDKQMLSEQLTRAKETMPQVKLNNLEQYTSTPIRNQDPFSPIQSNPTFVNNNYAATYSNQLPNSRYEANIYNTVAGDPSPSENFYDTVHSRAPSVIYDSTGIYGQNQGAMYDAVAEYGETRWQPQAATLRPAPAPPLSQQQINRRLEKLNQATVELMNKLSEENMTESEAREALEAGNLDQDLAIRHFKIERLSK